MHQRFSGDAPGLCFIAEQLSQACLYPCGFQSLSQPPKFQLQKGNSLGMPFDNPSRKANPMSGCSSPIQQQSRFAWFSVAIELQPIALLKTITPVAAAWCHASFGHHQRSKSQPPTPKPQNELFSPTPPRKHPNS
jgi:hypothetical protein